MTSFPKFFVAAAVFCALLLGCGNTENEKSKGDCLSQQPRDLKNLTVTGVRSRSNVVHELWKVICRMQAYHRAEKSQIEGTLKASFIVDFNGEMGRVEVLATNIEDQAFVQKIVALIDAAEFSFWGQEHDDTEVIYTFVFEKSS